MPDGTIAIGPKILLDMYEKELIKGNSQDLCQHKYEKPIANDVNDKIFSSI